MTFPDKLHAVREEIARKRVEAFIEYSPVVCGITISPITQKTHNRLVAFESPFVTGQHIDVEAVVVFVWLHHRDFAANAVHARRAVVRQVWRWIHPRHPSLNTLLEIVTCFRGFRWMRRFVRPSAKERFAEAVEQIRHLITEAVADMPRDCDNAEDERGEKGPQITAKAPATCFPAHVLNAFARELRLSHAETEAMPLKRLVQLYRECIVATGAKGIGLLHPDEARLWRAEMEGPA